METKVESALIPCSESSDEDDDEDEEDEEAAANFF